jgi:hypothetical protein
MWQTTSYQALNDAIENHRQALKDHRQALTTARTRAQALMTVLHEAEASFSAMEAASAQVQLALNDTLTNTESAVLHVNEPELGTKRSREGDVTSQHAVGGSSEALPEDSSGPPLLTPSAPLPCVAAAAPPRSEPSGPPLLMPSVPLLSVASSTPSPSVPSAPPPPSTIQAKLVSGATVSSDTEYALLRKMPRAASPCRMPHVESPTCDIESMHANNTLVLAKDEHGTWNKGVRRFRITGQSASDMLSWVVDNTSRTLSTITSDGLWLDGFHNCEMVHSGGLDAARQLQHTFVISRAHRQRALKFIPGLNRIVDAAKTEIENMHLHDTPKNLEWLTGHILNQSDVNARFTYHQDTTEERGTVGGRRDRHVLYTAIIKLNHGGCTSMQVCGQPEVFYLAPGGSGVIFRSNLHHRTEKAEPGIWKIALFFGVFL